MHIEPLIKLLKRRWLYRILLYTVTNICLALIVEIWKMSLLKIIILVIFMPVYIILYENLGIMFDRIKNKIEK